jgi:hypothetical protein
LKLSNYPSVVAVLVIIVLCLVALVIPSP